MPCLHPLMLIVVRQESDDLYRIRRSIYSLRCRLDVSFDLITHSVINSDVHVASKLNSRWIATLYNLAVLREADIFKAFLVIWVIFTCSACFVVLYFLWTHCGLK